MSNKAKKHLILTGLAIVVLVILASVCTCQIETGKTAIITTFGKVEDYTLEAGFHFKSPFQQIILMDNREKLDELANYLYERETITGDEFMAILSR